MTPEEIVDQVFVCWNKSPMNLCIANAIRQDRQNSIDAIVNACGKITMLRGDNDEYYDGYKQGELDAIYALREVWEEFNEKH